MTGLGPQKMVAVLGLDLRSLHPKPSVLGMYTLFCHDAHSCSSVSFNCCMSVTSCHLNWRTGVYACRLNEWIVMAFVS